MATKRDLMEVMVRTVGLILVVFFALQLLLLLVALAEMLFDSGASHTSWPTMGWTFPIYLGILLLLPVPFFLLAKRISCWIIREDREIAGLADPAWKVATLQLVIRLAGIWILVYNLPWITGKVGAFFRPGDGEGALSLADAIQVLLGLAFLFFAWYLLRGAPLLEKIARKGVEGPWPSPAGPAPRPGKRIRLGPANTVSFVLGGSPVTATVIGARVVEKEEEARELDLLPGTRLLLLRLPDGSTQELPEDLLVEEEGEERPEEERGEEAPGR